MAEWRTWEQTRAEAVSMGLIDEDTVAAWSRYYKKVTAAHQELEEELGEEVHMHLCSDESHDA